MQIKKQRFILFSNMQIKHCFKTKTMHLEASLLIIYISRCFEACKIIFNCRILPIIDQNIALWLPNPSIFAAKTCKSLSTHLGSNPSPEATTSLTFIPAKVLCHSERLGHRNNSLFLMKNDSISCTFMECWAASRVGNKNHEQFWKKFLFKQIQ